MNRIRAVLCQNLRFSWPKQQKELLRIDQFEVGQGEKLFVHGKSGSGKSSFLSLLAGFVHPTAGEVVVFGQSLKSLSETKRDQFRAQFVSLVFQQFNLIPYLSLKENVLLACELRGQKDENKEKDFQEIMLRLQLEESLFHSLPHEMSVGQQQRAAIARTLLSGADLILADEPSSALDEQNTFSFVELLCELVVERDKTLIFVSHDHRLSRFFDREVNLEEFNPS